tara:strand:- start:1721 stop:2578 length:858 start_codon:yes stop_codon:yes gene_type:complete
MFKQKHCSPISEKKSSCLSKKLLKKIAKIINKLPECSNIDCNCDTDTLYKKICCEIKKISDCDDEKCWGTINEIMNNLSKHEVEEFKSSFKPEMPESWKKEPNKWLNTLDINAVMEQYEDAFPKFKYFGATPIDFNKKKNGSCSVSDLCKINLKQLKDRDYEIIGMVFNTDDSSGSGQHWFSMTVDLVGKNSKKPSIYFFDSVANDAPQEIIELVKKLKKQGEKMNIPLDVLYSDVQHQYGDTECGIYCLHFITEMLKGKNFKRYINRKISDKEMEKFRKVFFNE